MKHMLTKT